ncbi:MurR/RpiR family transcriptional regulator [Nisaea sediminum]|uniref:MurR/RpiR family transcriptional regulator n=1 Tax=Nisaea sediminum TaxID=2775867 RepID=UPI001868B5A7|nr:MurR/RpiR family transcriptional regulator [Nisaea sediminum]
MDDLINEIAEALAGLSPTLQRAAAAVMENPGAVAVSSMRRFADRAKVSPPTMLRLARRMGYESYEDFRDVFRETLTGGRYRDRATDLRQQTREGGIARLVGATATAGIAALEQFSEPRFVRGVEKVATLIAAAPKTYIIATGATFGTAATFHYVCRMAQPALELVNIAGQTATDGIATIAPGEAVFAISSAPYAGPTIEAADYAKRNGAKVAILTDRPSSPLTRIADAAIFVGTRNPHYFPSKTSLNAALEAVSAAVAVKRGDAAIASIERFETALKNTSFYWSAAD